MIRYKRSCLQPRTAVILKTLAFIKTFLTKSTVSTFSAALSWALYMATLYPLSGWHHIRCYVVHHRATKARSAWGFCVSTAHSMVWSLSWHMQLPHATPHATSQDISSGSKWSWTLNRCTQQYSMFALALDKFLKQKLQKLHVARHFAGGIWLCIHRWNKLGKRVWTWRPDECTPWSFRWPWTEVTLRNGLQ